MATVDDLVDVQFYTSEDPYYYTVDNRPLRDLDENIRTTAAATDASAGSAERAALGAASNAYAHLGFGQIVGGDPIFQGQGMFAADYTIFGLQLRINHGFLVRPVDRGGSPAYIEPVLAVHDAVTSITPQLGRGGTLQVTWRNSTVSDRVASANSPVQVAEITFKQGTGPGIFPLPDANNIAIMYIDVPNGITDLADADITLLNMKTIQQIANFTRQAKITYESFLINGTTGSSSFSLAGSDIDTTRMDSVEIFIQGVNQFDWTYNSNTNQIVLGEPLAEDAEIRVRQTNIEYI